MSLTLTLLFGGAVRFLVPTFLPQLTDVLAGTAEISTPIDSFRSLQEAFFYLKNGMDLYDGAMVHHPPLFVVLMKSFGDMAGSHAPIAYNALFTLVDVGTAYKLTQLSQWYNTHHSRRSGRPLVGLPQHLIASFYLFNPLIILTNWAHSSAIFSYFMIVELLVQALIDHNLFRGAIVLGVAAYLSFNPVYLIVPYLALVYAVAKERDWPTQIVKNVGLFFFSVTTLVLISFALTALFDFVFQSYWLVLLFLKLAPNLGLWWYLFTEMFDFFNPLYKGIFNLYNCVFVLPLTLRFFESSSEKKTGDSFLAFYLCYLWVAFSKAYPIVGDLGLAVSMLPIFSETVIPYTKFLFLSTLTLITCLVLSPIFYYCWIVLGNGNSNFFYSMSLIMGTVYLILFLDIIWGRLVVDYIETNEVKDPKKLRLTQI
ncbi:PIG-U-domain-containing protein [Metschnikowia bicuspidata]|uniref:PIG-U-domain-containing protein n=1 Tax=Metschnikowia bicuspidata TaxID=27322 RepID=A0A4P9ZAE1_9ASCO|nr:PIG-U-domain-containing protein [Metschnikowia bicuspidata]